ncbi:MAG: chemotaxis protein CheX, partial [Thermoanaerobacteraceae bacterium]|nr:chemotaxis protein CheX [Thermoanaerobacteraceae bacterium]
EMSKSAIAESANMILGNAATLLYDKGIKIEITPPSLMMGDNIQISTPNMKTLCIPLILSTGGTIELDIALVD